MSAAVAWRVGWHVASQDVVWCMEAAQPWWVAGVARVCAWQMARTVDWHVRGLHGGRWRLWRSAITGLQCNKAMLIEINRYSVVRHVVHVNDVGERQWLQWCMCARPRKVHTWPWVGTGVSHMNGLWLLATSLTRGTRYIAACLHNVWCRASSVVRQGHCASCGIHLNRLIRRSLHAPRVLSGRGLWAAGVVCTDACVCALHTL